MTVESLEERLAPAVLIPVANRQDHVFDRVRQQLYISTTNGSIARYDVQSQTLLSPWNVGVSLRGLDLSPDGRSLYVAENEIGASQGFIRKVDTSTGTRTNLVYDIGAQEGGPWALRITSNGLGFFTSRFRGSGTVGLRHIDLRNDQITHRGGVQQDTHLQRSADRTTMFLAQSNISDGPFSLYDATTDTSWGGRAWTFHNNTLSAVSRDGTYTAVRIAGGLSIMDRVFNVLENRAGLDGGMAFDPVRDVLYAVHSGANQIVALSLTTWTELFRMDIGENIGGTGPFGSGVMTVSPDGNLLFLSTPSGVRMFNLTVQIVDETEPGFNITGPYWLCFDSGYMAHQWYVGPWGSPHTATWRFAVTPGLYRVSSTWVPEPDVASQAWYTLLNGEGYLATVPVYQQVAPADLRHAGAMWYDLGYFPVTENSLTVYLDNDADGLVLADAMRIERVGDLTGPAVQVLSDDGNPVGASGGEAAFPGARVGDAQTRTFTVRNLGSNNLNLTSALSMPAGFSVAANFGATVLAPGEATTFSIRANAAAAGQFRGFVSFGTNAPNANPFRFVVSSRVTSDTLIPVDRRDHVFDPVRQRLYISTGSGLLERYDLVTGTLLTPIPLGTPSRALDITPDGRFLYVTNTQRGAMQSLIRKVNLETGAVTNLPYGLGAYEAGAWSLRIASNGTARLTSSYEGSGLVGMRQLTLATDEITVLGAAQQNSHVYRGPDRRLLFFAYSNTSNGPIGTYEADTGGGRGRDTGIYQDGTLGAVNRDGTLIAARLGLFNATISILNRELNLVELVPGDGAVAFDPVRDVLYVAVSGGTVLAYDTNTWSRLYALPIGENMGTPAPFDNGVMTVSSDGTLLFVSTPSGIRILSLPGRGSAPGAPGFALSMLESRRVDTNVLPSNPERERLDRAVDVVFGSASADVRPALASVQPLATEQTAEPVQPMAWWLDTSLTDW